MVVANSLHERNKPWFYGPSLLLLFGTQICMAIEAWRKEHGAALRIWLDVWAEFEALNALATYAYENPEKYVSRVCKERSGEIRSRGSRQPAALAVFMRSE